MSIYVTYFRHAMVPPLALIWTVMRTASLCGYVACNVAWDLVMERQNRDFKGFVKHAGQYLRDRLGKAADMLNAFKHMWPRFLSSIGKQHNDEAYDKANIKQEDRDAMSTLLDSLLPATFAACCATDNKNAFKVVPARLRCPWDVVLEAASSIVRAADRDGEESDEDDGDDDAGSDGYNSADGNDEECKEDWFKHVTIFLKKVMQE
jgi:hypothetical protein